MNQKKKAAIGTFNLKVTAIQKNRKRSRKPFKFEKFKLNDSKAIGDNVIEFARNLPVEPPAERISVNPSKHFASGKVHVL